MKKHLLIFIAILALMSCDTRDCDDMTCFTPPPVFLFKIVDKASGENLYTNGTLNSDDIKVTDENGKQLQYTFITENNVNLLQANEFGWDSNISTYHIYPDNDIKIDIALQSKMKNENCCSFYEISEFSVVNYNYSIENSTGIITVEIPAQT